jgi:hypothetical protein
VTALHRRLRVVVDRYLPEAAARDLVRDLVTAVADHMLDGLYVPPKARGALRAANDCVPDDGSEPAVEVTELDMADARERLNRRGGRR